MLQFILKLYDLRTLTLRAARAQKKKELKNERSYRAIQIISCIINFSAVNY